MKPEKTHIRAFFAIELPQEVISLVDKTISSLKKTHKRVPLRWIKSEHLHITLQFLEAVKVSDIELLSRHIRDELSHFNSFLMCLNQLGLFPGPYHPRVISLNMTPPEKLAELSQAIGRGIQSCGYPIEERTFRGHLTLARIKNEGIQFELDNVTLPVFPEFWVNEVILFRSEPTREGSNYIPIEKFSLSNQ